VEVRHLETAAQHERSLWQQPHASRQVPVQRLPVVAERLPGQQPVVLEQPDRPAVEIGREPRHVAGLRFEGDDLVAA
jgi:hypothetical protein